ncbi:MAG: phospholipase effector Tle1 domain-containing protein, partial [Caulobacteraceae bacterium]
MKRIVICMDGTWQTLRQDKPTNIGLIARSVAHKQEVRDESGNVTGYIPQPVIYTHGVGSNIGALTKLTFGSWLAGFINRTFGGALGDGLEDGILDTYLRLAFNYEEGDEIYIFGFSRGAFAARRLAGVINTSGIISRRSAHKAWEAFQLYHDAPGEGATQEKLLEHAAKTLKFRQEHGKGGRNPDGTRYTIDTPPAITYLGVFDTVVQRGAAQVLDSMFPKLGRRYRFKNLRMCPNVLSARHAMAVDEVRVGFPATPWEGLEESNQVARRRPGARANYDYYQQRWFIGTHGDIGGGDGSPLA